MHTSLYVLSWFSPGGYKEWDFRWAAARGMSHGLQGAQKKQCWGQRQIELSLCTLRTVPAALFLQTKSNGMKDSLRVWEFRSITQTSLFSQSAKIWTQGPSLSGSTSCLFLLTYLNGWIIVIYERVRHLYLPFLHHLLQNHLESANEPMEQRREKSGKLCWAPRFCF